MIKDGRTCLRRGRRWVLPRSRDPLGHLRRRRRLHLREGPTRHVTNGATKINQTITHKIK